jgi:D-alanine-D-alanine ligase
LLERPLRAGDGAGGSSGSSGIYSYADKYLGGASGGGAGLESAPRELPAQVPPDVVEAAHRHARTVTDVVGLRGLARIDFLLVDGELMFNEVNTIPGAMGLYLWPKELPIARLLLDAVEEARLPGTLGWPTAGADGTALRAAGGISAKLLSYDESRR